MATEKTKGGPPPYATFSSFLSFINKLRDTTVPSRIDASVFGNASGSLSYSIIATLKFMRLIDSDGKPTKLLVEFVAAPDDSRKAMMMELIAEAYPSFFGDEIDIAKATAGQFDEHIRKTFDSSGSTVDKIAGFFIGAANFAGMDLSPLIKNRKQVAASPAAGKSKKQRRAGEEESEEIPPPPPPVVTEAKPLQYQLIDMLQSEGIGSEEQDAVWKLVRYLAAKKTTITP